MADNPASKSSDYLAQEDFWKMVQAILDGAPALRAVGAAGISPYAPSQPVANLVQLDRAQNLGGQSPYLPMFPSETAVDYNRRRTTAPLTNIYADISQDLADKPFARPCELASDTPQEYLDLADNIDGQGNSLHVFAKAQFKRALDKAIDYIVVDFPKNDGLRTVADEKAAGVRPYWVAVTAERMLAFYTDFVAGQEIVTHARIYEPRMERAGFEEKLIERVRVLDRVPILDDTGTKVLSYAPATFAIYELRVGRDDKGAKVEEWVLVDSGQISIGIVPVVPFHTGERCGNSGWRIEPPLADLAHMQIDEFQQESNLKATKEQAAFPMLVGEGVSLENKDGVKQTVPVGPKAVLTAPPNSDGQNGTWKFIEPAATSLTFLAQDLAALQKNMRELGKQPMTEAQLTVVTTANVSMRATSAVQAWAFLYKDKLEQAFDITAQWLNDDGVEIEVDLFTDFAAISGSDSDVSNLLKGEQQGIFSKLTIREEFKRRGKLSSDYDPEAEEERIAEEQQGLSNETMIDPVSGQPIIVDPRSGKIIQPTPSGGEGDNPDPTVN